MVIAGIAIAVVIILVLLYNSLINKKNQVENSFGGMDVQLKKRYDLIPNLISAVKTYMKHEANTLIEITELRTKALSGGISDDEKVIDISNINNSSVIGEKNSKRVPMTRLQRTMAKRLKVAQNTAAMLTTFNEIDMTEVRNLRSLNKDAFAKKYATSPVSKSPVVI